MKNPQKSDIDSPFATVLSLATHKRGKSGILLWASLAGIAKLLS